MRAVGRAAIAAPRTPDKSRHSGGSKRDVGIGICVRCSKDCGTKEERFAHAKTYQLKSPCTVTGCLRPQSHLAIHHAFMDKRYKFVKDKKSDDAKSQTAGVSAVVPTSPAVTTSMSLTGHGYVMAATGGTEASSIISPSSPPSSPAAFQQLHMPQVPTRIPEVPCLPPQISIPTEWFQTLMPPQRQSSSAVAADSLDPGFVLMATQNIDVQPDVPLVQFPSRANVALARDAQLASSFREKFGASQAREQLNNSSQAAKAWNNSESVNPGTTSRLKPFRQPHQKPAGRYSSA